MLRAGCWALLCGAMLTFWNSPAVAADWPMWRFDASRSAASSTELPERMVPVWTRVLSARRQVWDDALNLDLMTYDRVFEPIVLDGRMFVGFNDTDQVVAYDAATGRKLWSFFTSGPVRMPPAGHRDRVFLTSDDGALYCVRAEDGQQLWRFQGAPSSQLAIGNRRIVSAWPARGGAVVKDDTVYFAASIWPFMGTFIYALDAESGEVRWVNDETGAQYIKQPHSAPSFAGVGPQGALVATETTLLVPGGRSVPAAFDRQTGRQRYFEINAGGKGVGGSFVAATEQSWFVHTRQKGTREFDLEKGTKQSLSPNEPVLAGDRIYSAETDKSKPVIRAYDAGSRKVIWEVAADGRGDLILAGKTLYAAGSAITELTRDLPLEDPASTADMATQLTAIRIADDGKSAAVISSLPITGQIERLLAASDHLFAVTLDGRIMAFGKPTRRNPVVWRDQPQPLAVSAETTNAPASILSHGASEGYAIWIGAQDARLLHAVAAQSPFQELMIVDSTSERVATLRQQLDVAGLYGRVTAQTSSLSEFLPPRYIAHQFIIGAEAVPEVVQTPGLLARLYQSVRPYGGVMQLLAEPAAREALRQRVQALDLEQARVRVTDTGIVVERVGPLPGAGTWTHQYGNVANTVKSDDSRVKLPLGILWFGGSSNDDVLPRHGHGPPEQVIGGRLIIQGTNLLTARDVYTGRVLWKREFDDLGTYEVYYDETYKETPLDPAYNQVHIPGANARGTNYVVTQDKIYIVAGNACQVLDPATGETLLTIALPQPDPKQPLEWGYIGVYDDVLIGGVGFAKYRSLHDIETKDLDGDLAAKRVAFGARSIDRAASRALVGFDRHTGKQLWQVDAAHSFWHNGVVAGNGRVYALDKNPKPVEEYLRRRGKSDPGTYRILAFDVRTGKTAWESTGNIFGTWLGYSETRDLLLQAGASASDRLSSVEAGQGMTVYDGSSGNVVWNRDDFRYSGPCVLHNDLVITNANSYSQSAGAFSLLDGSQKMIENPLTGREQPWKITRAYGCNNIIASENLLTFRSGAAGFYDLLTESGSGNFGGFKSGCTSNLVVADGVLNAPDYTRTCSCAYQNQTSLALVHMPDVDAWTISNTAILDKNSGPLRQVGINLGAPGDRRDPHGLMWLEYPAVAGDSPDLGLEIAGPAEYFQHHPTTLPAAALPWVAVSGVEGLTGLTLKLRPDSDLASGSLTISHPDDDAEESADGGVNLTSSRLEIGEKSGPQQVAIRFENAPFSPEMTLKSAHLQLVCHTPGDKPTTWTIRAELSPTAERPKTTKHHLSQRALTKASVTWQPPAWEKEGDADAAQRSPDLSALIQEVIAQPDWQPGNPILFVLTGTGQRIAKPFRSKSEEATQLVWQADKPTPAVAESQRYRLRLHFGVPRQLADSERVFDIKHQGRVLFADVRLGGERTTELLTIENLPLSIRLDLEFVAKQGQPLLSGIELQRQDQ